MGHILLGFIICYCNSKVAKERETTRSTPRVRLAVRVRDSASRICYIVMAAAVQGRSDWLSADDKERRTSGSQLLRSCIKANSHAHRAVLLPCHRPLSM